MKRRIFKTAAQTRSLLHKAAFTALLIAVGIIIALFSPVRIQMEPASFTPALHVPIFIALFISPPAAIAVAIGTALGFFIGDFPPVIAWRAVSHVFFAFSGSMYLYYRPQAASSFLKMQLLSIFVGLLHAWAEVIVVYLFYMDSGKSGVYFTRTNAFLLVGLGGLVHSMIDFIIARVIIKVLTAKETLKPLFISFQNNQARQKDDVRRPPT
jgi:niacin transporter